MLRAAGKLDKHRSAPFMKTGIISKHTFILKGKLADQEIPVPLLLERIPGVTPAFMLKSTFRQNPGFAHGFDQVIILKLLPQYGKIINLTELTHVKPANPLLLGNGMQEVDDLRFTRGRSSIQNHNIKCITPHGHPSSGNSLRLSAGCQIYIICACPPEWNQPSDFSYQ